MFEDIKADFDRCCRIDYGVPGSECHKKTRVWFNGYGLQALAVHRFYRWSHVSSTPTIQMFKMPFRSISKVALKIIGQMYDINISPQAIIEPGCYIGHFGGIHLGMCRIGRQCNINHQVQIGNDNSPAGRVTEVGERVWIGAHSKIDAGIQIGSGTAVSAGSVITSDISEKVLVAGASGRILQQNYDNSHLLGMLKESL